MIRNRILSLLVCAALLACLLADAALRPEPTAVRPLRRPAPLLPARASLLPRRKPTPAS